MRAIWIRIKYLGFEPFLTARLKESAKGNSTHTFQANLADEYTWWQRLRLGLLLLFGVNLADLHVPLRKGGNIEAVTAWVEGVQADPELHKTVCDALHALSLIHI